MKIEVTPRMVDVFKKAWHAADAAGEDGFRVEQGLKAVMSHLEVQGIYRNREMPSLDSRLKGLEPGTYTVIVMEQPEGGFLLVPEEVEIKQFAFGERGNVIPLKTAQRDEELRRRHPASRAVLKNRSRPAVDYLLDLDQVDDQVAVFSNTTTTLTMRRDEWIEVGRPSVIDVEVRRLPVKKD